MRTTRPTPSGASTTRGSSRPSRSVRFAHAARALGHAARLRGLEVPSFRSPPGLAVHRTIRWRRGHPTISISLDDRPWSAVLADMIEGVVVANRLTGARADTVRQALWLAVEVDERQAAA